MAHCSSVWMSVITGRPSSGLDIGKHRHGLVEPGAALAAERRAVGLVEDDL
jgi:hypothetical protein